MLGVALSALVRRPSRAGVLGPVPQGKARINLAAIGREIC